MSSLSPSIKILTYGFMLLLKAQCVAFTGIYRRKMKQKNTYIGFKLDKVTEKQLTAANNKYFYLHKEQVHLWRRGHIVPPRLAQNVDLLGFSLF